jgi:hypothetical protein
VDTVDAYDIFKVTVSYDLAEGIWGFDLVVLNILNDDGINSKIYLSIIVLDNACCVVLSFKT